MTNPLKCRLAGLVFFLALLCVSGMSRTVLALLAQYTSISSCCADDGHSCVTDTVCTAAGCVCHIIPVWPDRPLLDFQFPDSSDLSYQRLARHWPPGVDPPLIEYPPEYGC